MIQTLPTVTISGTSLSPYSVDFNYGGNEKSEMTLTFIDRNGNYEIENDFILNTENPISVKIGNFNKFTGYIVNKKFHDEPGRATFSILLWDTSIILDQYHIGLKGLQGPGFSTTAVGDFGNTIFVGKQVDPCKNIPPNYPDPCAPDCGDGSGGPEVFNCLEEKQLKILEVDYSFPELKEAVAGIVKFGAFPTAINTEYRSNYTGTLREVLKSWCQDFAIDFYWSDNAVYFFDQKSGIPINDSAVNQSYILSKDIEFSIQNNYTQGNIVYFGGEGEKREYSCSRNSSKRLTLRPITLVDILEDDDSNRGQPGYSFLVRNYNPRNYNRGQAFTQLFQSIVLNYYSENFRNLYVLFEKEDLDTADKMYAFSQSKTRRAIPTLGNLRPSKVCYVKPDGTGFNTGEYYTLLKRMSANEQVDFIKRGGYFMVAKYSQEIHDKFNNFEQRLGEEFMGKYWVRGGIDGDSFTYNAPDGQPTYYSNGAEMQFPFIEIMPVDIQRTSDFIEDLIGEYNPSEPDKSHGRFVVMERSAAWIPNKTADSVKKIMEELDPYGIEVLGAEDVNGANILKEGEVWMKVFPRPKGLDLNLSNRTREEENAADAKNVGVRGELNGVVTQYGLISAKTQSYGLKTPSAYLKIVLPSQAGPYEGTHYPGYSIFANGGDFENAIVRIIPKAEFALGSVADDTSKDVGIQVNFRDITQNILDMFQGDNQTCGYNPNKILAALQQFNARFETPTNIEKQTRSYEIAGIPDVTFTAKDGLQSFSINHSDSGVSTSLTFSNLPEVRVSENLLMAQLKKTQTIFTKAKKYFKQFNSGS